MKNIRMETMPMAIPVENRRGEGGPSGRFLPRSPFWSSLPPSGGLPPPPPPRESSMVSSISGGAIVPGIRIPLARFASLPLSSLTCLGNAIRGKVLRNKIFSYAGHVEFISASINNWLPRAKIVCWRRSHTPFECGCPPRVAVLDSLATKQAPEKIKQENPLGKHGYQDAGGDERTRSPNPLGNRSQVCSRILGGVRNQTKPVHRHKHTVYARERQPEMQIAQGFVHLAPKELGKPEKQSCKYGERRSHTHDQMKMPGHEILSERRGSEIVPRKEESREPAGKKERNKPEREQQGGVEPDARVPKRAKPTDHKNRCGQAKRRGQNGKHQRRKGIQAARKHVLAPNAKPNQANATKSENDSSLLPHRLSGKSRDQMRNDAKAWEHRYVDFGLCEEPEQPLPDRRQNVSSDAGRLRPKKIRGGEKVCSEQSVGQQAKAGS